MEVLLPPSVLALRMECRSVFARRSGRFHLCAETHEQMEPPQMSKVNADRSVGATEIREVRGWMVYLSRGEYGQVWGCWTRRARRRWARASASIEAHCRRPSLGVAQYVERKKLTAGSLTARLTYLPLSADAGGNGPVVMVQARYAMPRRGELNGNDLASDVARAFGLPGQWSTLQPGNYEVVAETGEFLVYPSLLGLSFNEVEVTYNAGLLTIPDAVKFACVQMVRNAQAMPALTVKRSKVERLEMEYFGASLIDESVKSLLAPYRAELLG